MVRAYVHASKPSKAWGFFEKIGNGPGKDEQDARKMMELLANQYFGDGQYILGHLSKHDAEQIHGRKANDGCDRQPHTTIRAFDSPQFDTVIGEHVRHRPTTARQNHGELGPAK